MHGHSSGHELNKRTKAQAWSQVAKSKNEKVQANFVCAGSERRVQVDRKDWVPEAVLIGAIWRLVGHTEWPVNRSVWALMEQKKFYWLGRRRKNNCVLREFVFVKFQAWFLSTRSCLFSPLAWSRSPKKNISVSTSFGFHEGPLSGDSGGFVALCFLLTSLFDLCRYQVWNASCLW